LVTRLVRPAESTLSDDDDGYESDDEGEELKKFAFPELDQKIRECIKEYGAVFPKLNFSSPKVIESFHACALTEM